jgi:ketosteroid isomerase-like protein
MRNKVTKSYLIQSIFVLLIISLSNVARAENTEEKIMNSDKAKILSTIESMTSAFNQKDIGGVLASYEGGAMVMFEPGAPVSAPELLKQMFEGAFQINPKFDYPNGHEVYIANDIALHTAPWVMIGKTPDGTEVSNSGLSIAVLRKQEDGHWLMVLDNPNGQSLMEQ